MKVSVAQLEAVNGDIEKNITTHLELIDIAVKNNARSIVFPELSITGYEPKLAKDLAFDLNDERLVQFQNISKSKNITISIGLPLKGEIKPSSAMLIFNPDKEVTVYSKQELPEEEKKYFEAGNKSISVEIENLKFTPALSYESSLKKNWTQLKSLKPDIYVASVFTSISGIMQGLINFSNLASDNKLIVLKSNSIGKADNRISTGKSSVWNTKGDLLGQMNSIEEGILVYDLEKQIVDKYLI